MHKTKIIAITLISLLAPAIAYAAGIQVSPSRLDFSVTKDNPSGQNIVIANPTANVQVFEVFADDFTDVISANPASFTLEAGERKTVKITVSPDKLGKQDGQIISTNLSIIGKPLLNSALNVGTGVKLPLSASLSAGTAKSPVIPAVAAIAGLILVILVGFALKKRRHLRAGKMP